MKPEVTVELATPHRRRRRREDVRRNRSVTEAADVSGRNSVRRRARPDASLYRRVGRARALTSYASAVRLLSLTSYVFSPTSSLLTLRCGVASSTVVSDFIFFFYAVSRPWGLLLLSSLQASNYSPVVEAGHWVEVDRTVKFGAAPSLT